MEMIDREKVINGLECCIERDPDDHTRCGECPYESTMCGNRLKIEALALLKAQQPRVMTLEEVNALDWDYCYLEEERLPGKVYRSILGKHVLTCVTWPSITAAKITHGCDGYGKTWRCWTSRPTDAQREAEPWKA